MKIVSASQSLRGSCSKPWLVAVLCVLLSLTAVAQEVCDNGVDDDGNGLVDLNDAGCPCATVLGNMPSFIPNPSFEEMVVSSSGHVCCPYSYNFIGGQEFNCALGWHQATQPTADLFHSCGLFPDVFPLPPPDGEACVGLRMVDGWQEYVGRCLTTADPTNVLHAGVEYRLSFHAAGTSIKNFGNLTYSLGPFYPDPIPLAVYGIGNCPALPINALGCPIPNGWVQLGEMDYYPDGGWTNLSFTFTPDQELKSIMLGTGCVLPASFTGGEDSLHYTPYLLLDDLHLTEAIDQVMVPVLISGHPCTNDVVATATPPTTATNYQWYRNGVAVVGQTGLTLAISALGLGVAEYTLACQYLGECLMGSARVAPPVLPPPLIHLDPNMGCVPTTVAFADSTGPGAVTSAWEFGDGTTATGPSVSHTYTAAGVYDVTLTITTPPGCISDSTYVAAVIIEGEPTAVISVSPDPADVADPLVTLSGSNSNGAIVSWWWDLGTVPPLTSQQEQLTVPFPGVPGTYPIRLAVRTAAGCVDTVSSVVTVTPFGELELPNVFSPNSDGHNDRFIPIFHAGVSARMDIYNRWGQLVYTTTALASGWDGHIEGGDAPAGTYYYIVTPTTDQNEPRNGHITLLR